MGIEDQIKKDITDALKNGDTTRRLVLSYLRSAFHNKAIEKGKKDSGLNDEEAKEVIATELKRRREAKEEFEKAGRTDLAEKEQWEAEILASYLPPQLDETGVRAEIEAVLNDAGTRSRAEFGSLMSQAMARLKGRADGALVRSVLEKMLE